MKYIPLTKGLRATVDDDQYEELSKYKWHSDMKGYATRTYRKENGKQGAIMMHRQLMDLTDPKIQVDHINHDKVDNRLSNLRICTNRQNIQHQRVSSRNSSGFKGVTWRKYDKRWAATIGIAGKNIHLGQFLEKEKAARTYDKAAKEYFGEFAVLNFP